MKLWNILGIFLSMLLFSLVVGADAYLSKLLNIETVFPFAVAGLIVFPLYFVFRLIRRPLGWDRDSRLIRRLGRSAEAVVVSLDENSGGGTVLINEQPYLNLFLEVHEKGVKPYFASLDAVIPQYALPQFQPGSRVEVLVHPYDPQKLRLRYDSDPIVMGAAWSDDEREQIKHRGQKAEIVVVSVEPTGRSEGFEPVVTVRYEVLPAKGEPYQIEQEAALPDQMITQLRGNKGKRYKAQVHPEDKGKVYIHFDFKA